MPPTSSSTESPVTDQPSSSSEEHSGSQAESHEEPPAEEHRESPADPSYDSSNASGGESKNAQESLLDKRLQFEDAEIEEPEGPPKITLENLSFWYGDNQALEDISMEIFPHEVTALIGPSGCGKSTLLRCLNRMNEMIDGTRLEGSVEVDGQNIYENADPVMVRRRIGMVFQKPNPFPKSIFDNVVWGARINGFTGDQDQLVEKCLRQAALWDEVKDRLDTSAYDLSGGQQQRLCIARALAVEPNVLLMDEPASALDPIATAKLEETIQELTKEYTIVIVTHNMQQAARISDSTAFLYMGRLIEMDRTDRLFTRPSKQQTENYITGRFG